MKTITIMTIDPCKSISAWGSIAISVVLVTYALSSMPVCAQQPATQADDWAAAEDLLLEGWEVEPPSEPHPEHAEDVVVLTPSARKNFGVETVSVVRTGFSQTLDLYGWVRPRPQDISDLRLPYAAQVLAAHVELGDVVAAGDPLATLVVPEQLDWCARLVEAVQQLEGIARRRSAALHEGLLALTSVLNDLREARAVYRRAAKELEFVAAAGEKAVARQVLVSKEADLDIATAELEAACQVVALTGLEPGDLEDCKLESADVENYWTPEIQVLLAELDTEDRLAKVNRDSAKAHLEALSTDPELVDRLLTGDLTALTAQRVLYAAGPGIVTRFQPTIGAFIPAGESLMQLTNYDQVHVNVEIPETDIERVVKRVGDLVWVTPESFEGLVLPARVSYLDSEVARTERMAHLVIDLDNIEDNLLRDGLAVRVSVPLTHQTQVLVLPRSSLIDDKNEQVVFVEVFPNEFERRIVEVGEQSHTQAEITSGLAENETVASRGVRALLLAHQRAAGEVSDGGGNAHHGHSH